MVAGHLQEKKGLFYVVLNFIDAEGKRKSKWISTGLPVKGNKRKAEAVLLAERQKYQSGDYCLAADANMLFADYMLYWLRQVKASVDVTTYEDSEDDEYNIGKTHSAFFPQAKGHAGRAASRRHPRLLHLLLG